MTIKFQSTQNFGVNQLPINQPLLTTRHPTQPNRSLDMPTHQGIPLIHDDRSGRLVNQSSRLKVVWHENEGSPQVRTCEKKNKKKFFLVRPADHLHNNTTQHSCHHPSRSNCQRGHPPYNAMTTQQPNAFFKIQSLNNQHWLWPSLNLFWNQKNKFSLRSTSRRSLPLSNTKKYSSIKIYIFVNTCWR